MIYVFEDKCDDLLSKLYRAGYSKEEVVNCLIWRQQDATRNSIEAVGQAHFSAKELHGKSREDIQEMLWSGKGINWNNFDTVCKRGSCCYHTSKVTTMSNPMVPEEEITVSRSVWFIDTEPPIFTQDKEYVEKWIR